MSTVRVAVAAIVFSLSQTASSQQPPPPQIRAPVNVMVELYKGCIISHFQVHPFQETSRADTQLLVQEVDDKCLGWMVIWYGALMGVQVDQLAPGHLDRFSAFRAAQLQAIYQELIETYKVKK